MRAPASSAAEAFAMPMPRVSCRCTQTGFDPAILTTALVNSPTCLGPANPTVSATATMSTPTSYNFSAIRITSFGSTGPTIEQPSAIEIAALTTGLCELASRKSQRRLTFAIAESRERLALAWLCSSVAETTEAISATPDAKASLTPRSLSASATPCAPGSSAMVLTISRTSANCGNVLAGRNEPTSKYRTPAAYSSRIQRCLTAVDGNFFTSWSPSRKPTSRKLTRSLG